ncbi:SUR7/PalI family-domain-containing protein [Zalerion maritima]|uniref:SUR7/PalI family-domain-containing protein n=1 Tax=Zalerion maritima TaxID=339359 RepID=A0AAD5RI77_9PEZI|nr:SUR7/PalI family-domain-containing protein [Zalerion maritima]
MVGPLNHATMGAIGLVFLGGAITMMMFVILSGLNSTLPLDETYFLRADTNGITGAKEVTQWTFFYICGKDNEDCGKPHAALPFGYAWDSNAENAPEKLIGGHGNDTTSSYYFYVWRFGWVFYMISLFFTVCAFFGGFLACLGRLGAKLSGLASMCALFFYTIAVSLMTVQFVKARDQFQKDGRDASIGKYAFGFSWGAWAAIFVAIVLFCVGGRGDKHAAPSPRRRRGLPGIFGRGRARSRTPVGRNRSNIIQPNSSSDESRSPTLSDSDSSHGIHFRPTVNDMNRPYVESEADTLVGGEEESEQQQEQAKPDPLQYPVQVQMPPQPPQQPTPSRAQETLVRRLHSHRRSPAIATAHDVRDAFGGVLPTRGEVRLGQGFSSGTAVLVAFLVIAEVISCFTTRVLRVVRSYFLIYRDAGAFAADKRPSNEVRFA